MNNKFSNAVTNYRLVGANGAYFYGSAKRTFANAAKRYLRRVARELGLNKGQYDVRFNAGGPAVSGEATLHTDHVYVQVSAQPYQQGREVLFRTCNGRKDYSGGRNHFAPAEVLDDPAAFANVLKALYIPKEL